MDAELKSRWRKRIWVVAAIAIVLFGDALVSKLVFYSLCSAEGGHKIHRVAENIDSILLDRNTIGCDGHCMELLGKNRYPLVEVHVDSPHAEAMVPSRGNYKFYLANRGASECTDYEQALRKNPYLEKANYERYGIAKSQCVASVRVNEFSSRYAYVPTRQDDYLKLLRISRIEKKITDRSTSEVLATSTAFARVPGGWLAGLSGFDPGNDSCHTFDSSIIDKVLKPAQANHTR